MSASSEAHYQWHLGPVYTWMAGGAEARMDANRRFFDERHFAASAPGAVAVDLGCGPGFQAIPLAERGFHVLAVDQCETLLEELRTHAGALLIHAAQENMLQFDRQLSAPAQLIVCMGDTLTHLESPAAVEQLLAMAQANLSAGGRLVLTFRDYAVNELTGAQRFIPVRSDESRIATVFLEYLSEHVQVTDLLYEKVAERWELHTSAYLKLRISRERVAERLEPYGLCIVENSVTADRMICLIAQKPPV